MLERGGDGRGRPPDAGLRQDHQALLSEEASRDEDADSAADLAAGAGGNRGETTEWKYRQMYTTVVRCDATISRFTAVLDFIKTE